MSSDTGPTRWLPRALAGLWLLDAGLQLQPGMFGRSFSGDVIYNAALMYQPQWLERFLYWSANLQARHLVLVSIGIAVVQTAIGLGLLWRPARRWALLVSLGWAGLVWVFGQGLGFMLTGTAMLEFGAPGSAILYILLALVVWSESRGRWPRLALCAWSGFWAMGALLHIPWRYPAAAVLGYNLQTAAQLQPARLSGLDYSLARVAYTHGVSVSLVLALLELALAASVWSPSIRRPSIWVAIGLTAVFWVLGQAMGGILTEVATDPNTGPPVALLGLYLLSTSNHPVRSVAPAPDRPLPK
ncbi:MAG: hypothetical protein ACYCYK_11790 [Candidatus Dormibacteria bacterium]